MTDYKVLKMYDHAAWLKSHNNQLSDKTLHVVSNKIVNDKFDSSNQFQCNCRQSKSKILNGNGNKQSQNSRVLVTTHLGKSKARSRVSIVQNDDHIGETLPK